MKNIHLLNDGLWRGENKKSSWMESKILDFIEAVLVLCIIAVIFSNGLINLIIGF